MVFKNSIGNGGALTIKFSNGFQLLVNHATSLDPIS